MVVYNKHPKHGKNIAFYTSTNLKDWTKQSHLPGYFECPELFELSVRGAPDKSRWVTFGADAKYALGQFDGRTFTPVHNGKHRVHYGPYYASQTFSNTLNNRRIQIGWAQIDMPGMPFNQTFTFPHRLTLRNTDESIRMFAQPVQEIQSLYNETHNAGNNIRIKRDEEVKMDVSGQLLDVTALFKVGEAEQVGVKIGSETVTYQVDERRLEKAPMNPKNGTVTIRVLLDRPMKEVIGNNGEVYITQARDDTGKVSSVRAFAGGGEATLLDFNVHELKSIWGKQ